jgi:hypothetical protein
MFVWIVMSCRFRDKSLQGTGSGSCQMAGFGITDVGTSLHGYFDLLPVFHVAVFREIFSNEMLATYPAHRNI